MTEPESIKNASKTAVALQSEAIVAESDDTTKPTHSLTLIETNKYIKDSIEGMADVGPMHINTPCPQISQLQQVLEDVVWNGKKSVGRAQEKMAMMTLL